MNTNEYPVRLDGKRLVQAKRAYTVRHVNLADASFLIGGKIAPKPGDLVLARVDKLGHHVKLELADGRRAQMYEGDEIIVCFGNRYAPDQFEGIVGIDLSPCHLVAAGGVAASVRRTNDKVKKPTEITPLGLLSDSRGHRLNLRDYATIARNGSHRQRVPVIAVVGTSMNSGKTHAAAQTIRGLTLAGYRVGAAKLTGTGAGGDRWQMADAGASVVVDFTDAGHVSTYMLSPGEIDALCDRLIGHISADTDVVVVEIADGLLQKETKALIAAPSFADKIDALVFCAGDSMGAIAGIQWLQSLDLPLRALSGLVTRSPLALREVRSWTSLPILDSASLAAPETGRALWQGMVVAPQESTPAVLPVAAEIANLERRLAVSGLAG